MQDITIKEVGHGYASEFYEVRGNINAYSDSELIDMCDRNNFGGDVQRYADSARVKVYID